MEGGDLEGGNLNMVQDPAADVPAVHVPDLKDIEKDQAPAVPQAPDVAQAALRGVIREFGEFTAALSAEGKSQIEQTVEAEIARVRRDLNEKNDDRIKTVFDKAVDLLHQKDTEISILKDQLEEKEVESDSIKLQVKDLEAENQFLAENNISEVSRAAILELKDRVGTNAETLEEKICFMTKCVFEVGLSIIEPFAADVKKNDMHKNGWLLYLGLAIAIIVFFLSVYEIWKSWVKLPWMVGRTVKYRRIRWLPDMYGLFTSVIEIILFSIGFRFRKSLHIVMFACVFNVCLAGEKIVRCSTKKERDYEKIRLPV